MFINVKHKCQFCWWPMIAETTLTPTAAEGDRAVAEITVIFNVVYSDLSIRVAEGVLVNHTNSLCRNTVKKLFSISRN